LLGRPYIAPPQIDQGERLVALIRRNRIIAQVLPFGAGAHASMEGSMKLMDFEDAPPLLYFEGVGTGGWRTTRQPSGISGAPSNS
jgi:hypothetical protein